MTAVSDTAPDASTVGRGLAAAGVAVAAGIVSLPAAFLASTLAEKTLLNRVFHLNLDYLYQMSPGQRLLGQAVIAVATGLFGAGAATAAALALVRAPKRSAFLTGAAIGYAVLLLLIALWVWRRPTIFHGMTGFNFALAWLGAFAGMYILSEPGMRATAR